VIAAKKKGRKDEMKTRQGLRRRRGAVVLAATVVAVLASLLAAGGASAAAIANYETSLSDLTAGGHPDVSTRIDFATEPSRNPPGACPFTPTGDCERIAGGAAKDIAVDLPLGLVGNPNSIPQCTVSQLATTRCPQASQVGIAHLSYIVVGMQFPPEQVGIFNMVPTRGQIAQLGLVIGSGAFSSFISFKLDPSDDSVEAVARNIFTGLPLYSIETIIWGIPGAKEHDSQRTCVGANNRFNCEDLPDGFRNMSPFTAAPAVCGQELGTEARVDTYQEPGRYETAQAPVPALSGCDTLRFAPTISVAATNAEAGAPTGLDTELKFPQNFKPFVAQETPPLRDVIVNLPDGMSINPASAGGLGACPDSALNLGSETPVSCPLSSKIGTVTATTPVLDEPLTGSVYVRPQASNDPASGEMFRLALILENEQRGISIRVPGQVKADPNTGRLQASFLDSPQLPVAALDLHLKEGPRAPLVNPPRCGNPTVAATLRSWDGEVVDSVGTFAVDQGCGAKDGFTPDFLAGTSNPIGGAFSPFTLRVARPEGQQNVSTIQATLPEGLLAKLAGVPLCPEAGAVTGNCPAASQVGTTTVGVGPGSNPIYVPQVGKQPTAVYLAGPYKGAPYSLVVKVPAQAGPFDLGTVTVRNKINIDPTTTQVSVQSDPLPQILGGIPISYRDIRVDVTKPEFTLNPTNCVPMAVTGTVGSSAGTSAGVSDHFQVADCAALGFAPKLALRLSGAPPRRGANPALKATLTPAAGEANIGRASVVLPATELLEQGHIKTVCTRVQFAADQCPAGSIYGHAKAWTPLLDRPLEGPVYLRSNGGERKLPDLVADLNGQIHVILVGYIDSVKRHGSPRIRTRFLSVPDAPVSRFVLEMRRGKKSLLANTTNLCKAKPRAEAALGGQNGKDSETRPRVKVGGCGGKAHKRSASHKKK
jgi:hypothetical protein